MKRLMKSLAALNIALFLAGTIVTPLSVYADDGDTTEPQSGTEPARDASLGAPAGSSQGQVIVEARNEDKIGDCRRRCLI